MPEDQKLFEIALNGITELNAGTAATASFYFTGTAPGARPSRPGSAGNESAANWRPSTGFLNDERERALVVSESREQNSAQECAIRHHVGC